MYRSDTNAKASVPIWNVGILFLHEINFAFVITWYEQIAQTIVDSNTNNQTN